MFIPWEFFPISLNRLVMIKRYYHTRKTQSWLVMSWLLVLLLLFSPTAFSVTYTDEPRFETVDGNLWIVAAQDRNITLATSSRGVINVNGQNLQAVVEVARAAARASNSRQEAISSLQTTVRRLESEIADLKDQLAVYGSANDSRIVPSAETVVPSYGLQTVTNRLMILERNLRRNECAGNPCKHGGKCLDLYMKFGCICPDGWEGRRCQKDTNECAMFAGTDIGCQNGATCVNKPGTYECICRRGYFGRHCIMQTNDCSSGSPEICDHGVCVTVPGTGIKCICDQGWTKAPGQESCSVDVDECITAPCSKIPKVNCINIPGSFRCESCPPGYTGNGHSCDDVNECTVNNGDCSVNPLVSCINTIGSSRCGPCPPGYIGDGKSCTFVGRCRSDNGGCHPRASCQETGTGVTCTCNAGFSGTGVGIYGCYQTSAVAPNNGHPCATNPCRNGRCLPTSAFNFTCDCFAGYSGSRCESPRNPCDSSPCQNGGTCVPRGYSFRCRCPKSYGGRYCDSENFDCGGLLTSTNDGFMQFPGGNGDYRPNLSCAWLVRVNVTKVLNITFEFFDLQPPGKDGCTADWIQLYDGSEFAGSNQIGKYCGNSLPNNGTIISTQNTILLWFKSDATQNFKGFRLRWSRVDPVCGGPLNASVHGSFASPGSPGRYPPNRDCYWAITTDFNQRITFTFFQFYIENHDNCTADYLEFFDGPTKDDPLITRFCTSGSPAPFVSPGNTVLVHFHSDGVSADRGFQIAYHPTPGIPGCGGVFTDRQGEISSLNSGNTYRENLDCVWLIRVHPDQRIKISFTSMSLETSSSCQHDFLEIRLGADASAPLAGKFCGNLVPSSIISETNEMYVRFRTDHSVNMRGFRLIYEELCSQMFVDPTGFLQSPNYPKNYPDKTECTYLISQPPGKAIILNFLDFDLEASLRYCYHDYVQVFDGLDDRSALASTAGRFCGSRRPPQIISSNNKLFIKFRTDASINLRGWAANYSTIDIACGGIYDSPSGVISSPSSESRYLNDMTCQWVIHTPANTIIQLNFVTFILEGSDYAAHCSFDYLEIFNAASSTDESKKLGRFCGNKAPPPLVSSGNVLFLKFVTDSSRTLDGFQLTYAAINASSTCGGHYYFQSGVLRSPNYPHTYPESKTCTWVIRIPPGRQIRLITNFFKLEDSEGCNDDSVVIRNGGSELSPLIGKYCGSSKPPVITSFSNQLFIKFTSDSFREAAGFEMVWTGAITGCGGLATAYSGSITSPNYPEPYGHNALCLYRIRVAMGNRIVLNFIDVELEESENCDSDYVKVFDGSSENAKSLAKQCSLPRSSTGSLIVSSGNQLLIKFASDFAVSGKGFAMNYYSVCNDNITGTRGVIENPNYPDPFAPGFNCVWKIVAEMGHTINLTFTEFSYPDSDCSSSYILVEEGERDQKHPNALGKYCAENDTVPTQIINSSLEVVWISLVSTSTTRGVFRAEWVEVGCGGSFNKPAGSFTSPNYPNLYPKSTRCVWKITVDPEHSIELTVSDIHIESTKDCVRDALEVYGGPDLTSPKLAKYCGLHQNIQSVSSSGNYMTVVFISDISETDKGFSATFKSIPSKCGGVQQSLSGAIHSPNYPNNFDSNDDCLWTIRVDPQHRVNFTFDDFDMPDEGNCTHSYVQIFDGDSLEAPSLLKVCGNRMPNVMSLISTGNTLLVRLKSGLTYATKGFKASYFMTCGSVIDVNEAGTIVVNDALTTVHGFLNCTWKLINSQPDGHITAAITLLNFHSYSISDPCLVSYLEIFDGENDNATSFGRYCGSTIPLPYISSGNALFVKYRTVWFQGSAQIAYSPVSSACGGELNALSGTFASPGYPGTYPANVECVWELKAAPGNFLQMSIDWKLGSNDNCNTEFIEIRRSSATGEMLGVFCDANVKSFTSLTGFWVKFESGKKPFDSATPLNFKAEYSLVKNNELNGTSGEIASPMYPRPYHIPIDGEMTWRVTVDYSKKIKFTFVDFLVNSRHGISLFDGYDETAAETKFGSVFSQEPFISSSNIAVIKLTAGFFETVKFLIKWEEIASQAHYISSTDPTPEGCGGDFFLSPQKQSMVINYPRNVTDIVQCEWVVRAPMGYHLGYRILKMNMLPSIQCHLNGLATYDGDSEKPIKTYCLQNETHGRDTAVEVGSTLRVVYSSRMIGIGRDFQIQVDLDQGGVIEASNGLIDFGWNDSDWRWWIQKKASHEWTIKVNQGRRIRVTFEQFDVNAALDGTCKEKFVMLRNGHHSDSPFLGIGKYCGNLPENIPLTSSEYLFVKITTPWRTSSFKMRFEEVSHSCGGRLRVPESLRKINIRTPNYPNSPHPKIQCTWIIQGPVGRTLHVDFPERFDLKATDDYCTGEYVEIFDGSSTLAESLGRFCRSAPSTIKTSDNVVLIKYFTNVTDPNNGFSAAVSLDSCNGVIRSRRGTLTSPGYPNLPSDIDCTWKIETGPYEQLQIEIVDFELPLPSRQSSADILQTIPRLFSARLEYLLMRKTNCTLKNSLIFSETPFTAFETNRYKSVAIDEITAFCSLSPPLTEITTASNAVYIRLTVGQFSVPVFKGFKLKFDTVNPVCGGYLGTPDGVISSPLFPKEIPRPYHCVWTVRVVPGRRITVRFSDFDLAGNNMEQRVYLYESSMRSEIAVLHKLSPPKDEYKTSGNTLKVSYHAVAFSGTAHRGFRLTYSSNEAAECGGFLNSTSGVIEPPSNATKFYCEWVFPQLPQINASLVFNLENARLGNATNFACNFINAVGLMIYEPEDPAKFSVQLCGNVSDQIIVSPFGSIKVKSTQSKSFSAVSFRMRYRVSNCGGVITPDMLPYTLTSPGFYEASKYPSNSDCAWKISTEPGQTLKVNFIEFQLEKTCRDYLVIYNGGDPSSPLVDSYCGVSTTETSFVGEDENLYFRFHSDESTEGRGFKILIENNHTDCGGILYNSGTDLRTPGFPNNKYDSNLECEWELRSRPGSHIGLVFTDRFHLESSEGCVNDFVKIYDYKNGKWQELKTLCGRETPAAVNSTSDRMRVLFRSNSEISGDGFRAVWFSNCGAVLNDTRGRILSPGYPLVYPPNQNCEYVIHGDSQLITLNFTFFQLENSPGGCQYDFVEIWESSIGNQYKSLGRFCGNDGPHLMSTSNDLKIIFKTDGYSQYPGFIFEYTVDKCGGEITESTVIQYTLPKNTNFDTCRWHIHDPVKNMAAAVRFTNVSLLSHEQCTWVSLKVMTRITPGHDSYKMLSRFCGKPETIFTFTGKDLVIELKQAIRSYGGNYFTALVSFSYGEDQGCGGKLIVGSNPETIISPDVNRDGFYEEMLECQWLIEAPENHYLTAKILRLDLQYCREEDRRNECCDFIEIRDGFGQFSDLILKSCGNSTPEAVMSSGNQMWLRLSTDDAFSGRGFSIQFSSQISPCGQKNFIASNQTATLTSPGYPAGMRCSWIIQALDKEGSRVGYNPTPIQIHLDSWDFPDSEDCSGDYLSIEDYGNRYYRGKADVSNDVGSGGMVYHGSRGSVQLIYTSQKRAAGKTKYCGKGSGLDFYASSKTVVVEMVTTRANAGKGFSLEFNLAVCSRHYTKNQGRIRRTHYVNFDKCVIRVTAPSANHTISLYFLSFSMPMDCKSTYMEVRDGPDMASNSILKTCGYNRPSPIYSTGRDLYIELYNNVSRFSDIDITYTTTDAGQGCGGEIFNYGGIFTSPKFPQYIRENGVCSWDVSVPTGLVIAFKFQTFDLGSASACNTDFIEFWYPGSSGEMILHNRFCGSVTVANFVGKTNNMIVKYTRSVHNAGMGWELNFAGVEPGFPIQSW